MIKPEQVRTLWDFPDKVYLFSIVPPQHSEGYPTKVRGVGGETPVSFPMENRCLNG